MGGCHPVGPYLGSQPCHHSSPGWSGLIWDMGAAPKARPVLLGRVRSSPLAPVPVPVAHSRQGRTWTLQKIFCRQTSRRGEFNFSFFQAFFRDHKYLWRACQSFLGFLTECVTREGLLWGFIVNCSKLYSCQGAERSYAVSGESKQSPQYSKDAKGGVCPCSGGHHKAYALLKCHFSPQTSAGMYRRNSLFLCRNHGTPS